MSDQPGPTPPCVLRKRPTSVAASTMAPPGSKARSRTEVAVKAPLKPAYEPESETAFDQVAPPSSEERSPGVWTSKGSPSPRSSESLATGFIAMLPTDSE